MYASLHSPARVRGRARSNSGSALLGAGDSGSSGSASHRLAEGVESALRARWLRHCLPIIAQATHDAEGNALACVFADFQEDNTACEVNLVYWSEASWNRRDPLDLNSIGTFAYRTWNRAVYGRTADIKRLTFHDVVLEFDFAADALHAPAINARCGSVGHSCPSCSAQSPAAAAATASPPQLPWRTMTSPDFSFDQTFRHGDAVNICCFFAFYRHYFHSQPSEEWTLSQGFRPLLYLNTCNHMFGPEDKNPDLPRVFHDTYPVLQGGRPTAEIFGRRFVPNRPHLWAPCIWTHARLCASPSLSALSLPPRLCQAFGGALFACGSFARHAAAWALGTRSGAGADEEVAAASTLERRWTRHHHNHQHNHHHHQQPDGRQEPLNSRRISVVVEEGPQEDSDAFVVEASTVLQCDTDDDGEEEGDGDSEGHEDADGPSGDSAKTLRDMETVAIGFPMDSLASPPRAGAGTAATSGRAPAVQPRLSDVALAQTPPSIGQRRSGVVPPPISLASLPPTGAALAAGASETASGSSLLSSSPATHSAVWPPPHLVPAFNASFLDWRRVQFAANGARRQTPAATPVAVRADAPHDTPPFFADLPRAVAFFTHAVWAQHELPPHSVRAGHPFFEAGRSGAIVWVDVTGVGSGVRNQGMVELDAHQLASPSASASASDPLSGGAPPLKSAARVIGPIAMHQTLALPGMHVGTAAGKAVH